MDRLAAWWFKKEFDSSEVDLHNDIIELVLEGLDSHADILINGCLIGTHNSVHYPFRYDIRPLIIEGTNTILVRMTSGLESVSDQDLAEINYAVCTEQDNGGKMVKETDFVFGSPAAESAELSSKNNMSD